MANVVCSWGHRAQRPLFHLVILITLFGFVGGAAAQTTITLATPGTQINADMNIQGGAYASADFSTSPVLASKVSSASYTRRIFLKIDTQNTIPANAVIQSAQLYLVLKSAESSENRPFTAYYVTRSFVTGQTTWYDYRDGQPWSTPGGDLGASFGTTYVANAVGSAYKFDLTRLVQAAVNGQFGSSRYTRVALIDQGASAGSYREFHSTRSTSSALRPRLVVTYSTSGSTTPPPPPPPSSTGTTLRLLQWNVHKTKGADGRCDPDRVASVIAAQHPDVVSLNEVNFFSGECAYTFDMGAKLETLLEQKTGATWYRQNVNVQGGSSGYGNVLLSRYAPVASGSHLVSYSRGLAQMTIVVNGRNVNVFSFQAEYYTASWRPIQIAEAASYVQSFSEPRIIMGDFNTNPGTSDYYIAAQPFQDAWAAAQSAGTAWAYNGTGATHGTSRFDYLFYSRVTAVALQSVKVPDSRVNGVYAADHDPVVTTITVK